MAGAGNRSAFRECLRWLAETDPKWIIANINQIPELGRWDDLRVLNGTPCEDAAVKLWAEAIAKKDGLACKWADRSDLSLLRELRKAKIVKDIGDFRRLLAAGRKNIVERAMCSNRWNEVEYPHVPSVAMSRYNKAFNKHDEARFAKFKEKVEKGEAKINASVVFPHDLARLVENGDYETANLQFKAMPNFLEGTNQRILCLCDSSGSMESVIAGSIQAIHVSTALSLYCSDRIGKDNPFWRKIIQFESESKLSDWSDTNFAGAYGYGPNAHKIFDGACGYTRIDKALDSILNHAKMFKSTNEQIPNVLLIISDMQFTSIPSDSFNDTVVESCMSKWEKAGYSRPKIVYWNISPYSGSPATINSKNVGLVSGFSTSILKAIFGGEDFSPKGIMMRAIEKYKVIVPS